jgi:hypothetical protein
MKSLLALIVSVLVLMACGETTPTPPNPPEPQKVTRLEITPGAVLLTTPGETQAFSFQAYDQNNKPVSAVATWSSSNTAVVGITNSGQATAGATLGSAILTAQAGDVKAVTVAVVAQVPAGTTLVTDAQVIKLVPVDPNAKFQVGYQYTVTLEGLPTPAIGSIVLARESASIAGKVVAVTANGTQTLVTLEVVPIPDLFTKLELNEVVDLSNVEPRISDATREYFDVTTNGKGLYSFSLKPGKVLSTTAENNTLQNQRPSVRSEFEVGPLECEATASAIKVELDKVETSVDLTSLKFKLDWSETQKNILLVGAPKTTIAYKPRLGGALEGKLTCKFEFFELDIPFPGFISFVFGARIPIGAGFELEGKMPLVGIGFDNVSETTTTLRIGLSCNPDCSLANEIITQEKINTTWVIPNILKGIKIELGAYVFFYADVNFGPQGIFRTLDTKDLAVFKFLEVKAGVKIEGKLASEATQADDKEYNSDYKASLELGIAGGSDVVNFLKFIKATLATKLEFKVSRDLDTSPTATATANRDTFATGDVVKFNVKLDKFKFLVLDYNVKSVTIYRKEAGEITLVAEVPVIEGQKSVDISWTATSDGVIDSDFIVFAKTKILPILGIELAVVKPVEILGEIVIETEWKSQYNNNFNDGTYILVDSSGSSNFRVTLQVQGHQIGENAWDFEILNQTGDYKALSKGNLVVIRDNCSIKQIGNYNSNKIIIFKDSIAIKDNVFNIDGSKISSDIAYENINTSSGLNCEKFNTTNSGNYTSSFILEPNTNPNSENTLFRKTPLTLSVTDPTSLIGSITLDPSTSEQTGTQGPYTLTTAQTISWNFVASK